MPDQKIGSGIGSLIKTIDQGVLCLLVKVDHYISAEYNVKLQLKLNRVHQVKGPEDDI